ncbi:CNNM domain-containing protein, partial [Clostridium paraputrificum]|uniref:CNNM domain-containing protein n=1 Tax=Clostridium paraputrificum TaxID=29363 RepID=UPI000A75C2B4
LVLIFGEVTPKSIAKQKAEAVALKVARFIEFAVVIFKPFIYIFTAISSLFIRLVGCDPNEAESFITEEELKTMVGVSEEEGVLDVMVQRVDIISIDEEATYDEVMSVIKSEQFSRIPVYNQTIDNIIGFLNVKDLAMVENPREDFNVKK